MDIHLLQNLEISYVSRSLIFKEFQTLKRIYTIIKMNYSFNKIINE